MIGRACVVLLAVAACSRAPAERSTQVEPATADTPGAPGGDVDTAAPAGVVAEAQPASGQPAPGQQGSGSMTHLTCDTARQAIEARRFQGWRGLPASCTSDALFGVPFDDVWGQRRLGSSLATARSRLLELGGYYRPMASVQGGVVVMFDAMNPVLDAGWPALATDLGTSEATLDWTYGSVAMPAGERVYASRGITVFTNRDGDDVLHIAVYPPTSVEIYTGTLRPNLEKKPHPRK
jgi:hypothetical protein